MVLLELELWDTGERAMNKFDHILPACKQSTDGAMFFFSFIDRCVPLSVLLISAHVLHSFIDRCVPLSVLLISAHARGGHSHRRCTYG